MSLFEPGNLGGIYIAPVAGVPMQSVQEVMAIAGCGLEGDRYATGNGSWNKGKIGKLQVTIANGKFYQNSGYRCSEGRRNLIIFGIPILEWIDEEFQIGEARFYGVKYCEPCERPTKLSKKETSFQKTFEDAGGIIANVLQSGIIRVGDTILQPTRNY